MRRFLVSAGLTVGLLFSSLAVSPAAVAAEKNSATASAPSTKQLDLARRYFNAMKFEQQMLQVYENLDMMEMFGSDDDEAGGLDRQAMGEAMRESIAELSPKMVNAMVPVVAGHFTEAELEAMVGFYESDLGKSVVDKSATLNAPLMQAVIGLLPDYMNDILDRYCSKTKCTPAMKDKLRKQAS